MNPEPDRREAARLLAHLGYDPVGEEGGCEPSDPASDGGIQEWGVALSEWGKEACVRALLAAARAVRPACREEDRSLVDAALFAAGKWIASQTKEDRLAALDLYREAMRTSPSSESAATCARGVAFYLLMAVAGKHAHAAGAGLGMAAHAIYLASGAEDATHVFFSAGADPGQVTTREPWASSLQGGRVRDKVILEVRSALVPWILEKRGGSS